MNKQELHKIFIIDLGILEDISREVGYANAKANQKKYDEDGDEFYDEKLIEKYETLRTQQLDFFSEMREYYKTLLPRQHYDGQI